MTDSQSEHNSNGSEHDSDGLEDSQASHTVTVVCKLQTWRSEVTQTSKKNSKKTTTKKDDLITKDFNFKFVEDSHRNYIKFLNKISSTFDLPYTCTNTRYFPFKIQIPPYNANGACNIDNYEEFAVKAKVMVETKVQRNVKIEVDALKMENAFSQTGKKTQHIDEPDGSGSAGNDKAEDQDSEASKIEIELGRNRRKVESRWKNDHDSGYTYINPTTGLAMPLTPFMIREWARAMYDNKGITEEQPPNTVTFDVNSRQSSLGSVRRGLSVGNPSIQPPSDNSLAHLATIISSITSLASLNHGASTATSPPKTPPRLLETPTILSPARNTPSKLSRFLRYAESTLGVTDAQGYEYGLRSKAFGPDILHQVPDDQLTTLDIPLGDIIRLKQGAPIWWKSADAKRKRSPSPPPSQHDEQAQSTFRVEKKFKEGGGWTTFSRKLVRLDTPPPGESYEGNPDETWMFWCSARQAMVPVPLGWRPLLEDEEDPTDKDSH